ncbi:MAG: sugar phosphate nucleotidyltransferase, partial [Candidatus Freyarchaeota archaeon]
MRALIPAAGRGTRLRPQTNTKPKSLLRVADKPIIGHILDNLKTTRIKEVIMIFLQTYREMLQKHRKNGECAASIGVKEVDQPQHYGNVEITNGNITRLVEKPATPLSNLAIAGVYIVNDTPLLYRALEQIIENDIQTGEEYQLTDALQRMIDWEASLKTFRVEKWYDCGRKNTLL